MTNPMIAQIIVDRFRDTLPPQIHLNSINENHIFIVDENLGIYNVVLYSDNYRCWNILFCLANINTEIFEQILKYNLDMFLNKLEAELHEDIRNNR
jgi:hypothetical protein